MALLRRIAAFHVVAFIIGLSFAAIASWDPSSGSNYPQFFFKSIQVWTIMLRIQFMVQ